MGGVVKPSGASPQPVEKIVVSNLPPDVNEAQVKVKWFFLFKFGQALTPISHIGAFPSYRRPPA